MYKNVLMCALTLMPLHLLAAEKPTSDELLAKYRETQDKLKSFTTKYDDDWSADSRLKFLPRFKNIDKDVRNGGYFGEIRSDGDRHYEGEKIWHDDRPKLGSKAEAQASPLHTSYMWDGQQQYQYMVSDTGPEKDWLFLNKDRNYTAHGDHLNDLIIKGARDKVLRGVFDDAHKRAPGTWIDEELKKAYTISVEDELDKIKDSECFVITAKSKDSKYKIWIDPLHGYNIAKAEIMRGGKGVEFGDDSEISLFTYLKNVRFEQVDGIWIPMEADYGSYTVRTNGDYEDYQHHIKRIDFVLNPDHEALGSFKPNYIRNGSRVAIIGIDGIKYTWQDGKLIPNVDKLVISELDQMAEEIKAVKDANNSNDRKKDNISPEISIPDGNDIFIPDANTASKQAKPFIFDFDTQKLIYAPDALDTEALHKYLSLLGKGDIGWSASVVTVRGAAISSIQSSVQNPMTVTAGKWCGFYKLPDKANLPYTFILSKDKQNYIVQIKEITKEGVAITYAKIDIEHAKSLTQPDANDSKK